MYGWKKYEWLRDTAIPSGDDDDDDDVIFFYVYIKTTCSIENNKKCLLIDTNVKYEAIKIVIWLQNEELWNVKQEEIQSKEKHQEIYPK